MEFGFAPMGLRCVAVVGFWFAMCDARRCGFAMCDGLYYGGLSGMVDSLHLWWLWV